MDHASSPHSCLFSILFLVFLVLPFCWSQRLLCRLCDSSRFVSRKSSLATAALAVICSARLVQSCRSYIPIIRLEIPQDMMCIHRKPGYVSMRTTSARIFVFSFGIFSLKVAVSICLFLHVKRLQLVLKLIENRIKGASARSLCMELIWNWFLLSERNKLAWNFCKQLTQVWKYSQPFLWHAWAQEHPGSSHYASDVSTPVQKSICSESGWLVKGENAQVLDVFKFPPP